MHRDEMPFLLWIWKGRGKINDQPLRAGDEFFVPHAVARAGIELESDRQPIEAFTFFPVT